MNMMNMMNNRNKPEVEEFDDLTKLLANELQSQLQIQKGNDISVTYLNRQGLRNKVEKKLYSNGQRYG